MTTPASTDRWTGRAVGLVLRRSERTLGIEAFYTDFMAGVEEVLDEHERAFVLQVVPDLEAECDTYRRWARAGRIVGVVVVDLLASDDPRPALLTRLGLAAVVISHVSDAGGHAAIEVDEAHAVRGAVELLAGLGHRRVARVSGPADLAHIARRTRVFEAAVKAAGIEGVVTAADFSAEGGGHALEELMRVPSPPSAFLFDNDVMAAAALDTAGALGLAVPGDISIIAGDDSVLCRVSEPPLTALARDIHALGRLAGEGVLRAIEGERDLRLKGEQVHLVVRDSTGPAH